MSLFSRLRGAAQAVREAFSTTKDVERSEVAQTIDKWTGQDLAFQKALETRYEAPEIKGPGPASGVDATFYDFVPEDDQENTRLKNAFDVGFGTKMQESERVEVLRARDEFLQYLLDEGIDLDDFWPDWRENYGEAA